MLKHELYPYWDATTYCTRDLYEEVTQTEDLRKVWSYASLGRGGRKETLTIDDIRAVCTDNCPVCGNELDYGLGKNNHIKGDSHTPSLDKLVPGESGGRYVVGNIWVICERCNRFKNSAYGEDDARRFETIAKVLRDPTHSRLLVEQFGKI